MATIKKIVTEQYIQKSALVAELEKRININKAFYMRCFLDSDDDRDSFAHKVQEDKEILSIINNLKTKEVDLDLEITLWANAIPEIRLDDVERLAKHFFELGLKAQKGEL